MYLWLQEVVDIRQLYCLAVEADGLSIVTSCTQAEQQWHYD
jgi:hypothetical protein